MIDLYEFENKLSDAGFEYICGVDEAGRGPLAGPVVAAAVILKKDVKLDGVNDSKKLSKKKRQALLPLIKENALAIGVCFVGAAEIDQINILRASRKAMMIAIEQLKIKPDYILSDAMDLQDIAIPFESLIHGDERSISIAAASIIAKETRDDYMLMLDKHYPEYGYKNHFGYPTKAHIEAVRKHGITPYHRKTFQPIKNMVKESLFKWEN